MHSRAAIRLRINKTHQNEMDGSARTNCTPEDALPPSWDRDLVSAVETCLPKKDKEHRALTRDYKNAFAPD
jgi:hypothetical protein